MGVFEVCKGEELVKYGSTQNGCGCNCLNLQDPNFIFTDGCLYQKTGQGGYGIYSFGLRINLKNYYPYEEHKNMVPTIELKGILEAIRHVKLSDPSHLRIDIFTDCEFALAHLVNLSKGEEDPKLYNKLGTAILNEVRDAQAWATKVVLHKVKAHSGIQGNVLADQYAKEGARKAPKLNIAPETPPPANSLHWSRQENDEFYSRTSASFDSYRRKRSRLSQSPSQNKMPSRASPSQAHPPAPAPAPPRYSKICASPSQAHPPAPAPAPPRYSKICASPSQAHPPAPPPSSKICASPSYGPIRKKQPVVSTGPGPGAGAGAGPGPRPRPRNHPYNYGDPKPIPSNPSSHSWKRPPISPSSQSWKRAPLSNVDGPSSHNRKP